MQTDRCGPPPGAALSSGGGLYLTRKHSATFSGLRSVIEILQHLKVL